MSRVRRRNCASRPPASRLTLPTPRRGAIRPELLTDSQLAVRHMIAGVRTQPEMDAAASILAHGPHNLSPGSVRAAVLALIARIPELGLAPPPAFTALLAWARAKSDPDGQPAVTFSALRARPRPNTRKTAQRG